MKATVDELLIDPPKQTVTLTLSVEEFALLENLRWKHVGGLNELRSGFEAGCNEAINQLHPHWRDLVLRARDIRGTDVGEGLNSYQIAKLFERAE